MPRLVTSTPKFRSSGCVRPAVRELRYAGLINVPPPGWSPWRESRSARGLVRSLSVSAVTGAATGSVAGATCGVGVGAGVCVGLVCAATVIALSAQIAAKNRRTTVIKALLNTHLLRNDEL